MSTPTCTLVDRITRGKRSSGVNWGGPIVVYARMGHKELWKVPGSNCPNRMGPRYVAGELVLVHGAESRWSGHFGLTSKTLQDGGRISRKTFLVHAEAINEFFGCDIASQLDPRKTLLIDESP